MKQSPLRDQVAGIGRADYPPTQAQIKAALDAAIVLINAYRERAKSVPVHYEQTFQNKLAALTAAAEAGPKLDDLIAGITEENRHPESFAAEAGEFPEPTTEQIEARWERKFKDAVRNIENKAIERCAQVAESGIQLTSGGNLIAAAIRALKEQP